MQPHSESPPHPCLPEEGRTMAGGLPCKAKVYERMRLGQPADQHQDEKAKLLGHGVHRARLATVKSDSLGVPEFSSLSAHRDLSGWLGISTSVKRGHDILLHTKNLHTMSMIDTFSCLCSYACALSQPRATSPYTSTSPPYRRVVFLAQGHRDPRKGSGSPRGHRAREHAHHPFLHACLPFFLPRQNYGILAWTVRDTEHTPLSLLPMP